MPTYQYQCTECGNGLEAVQKFTDEPLTTCPDCQGRLRKVFSAVGVVFKGSGFYRTDSRSSSSSSVGSGSSSSSSSTSSSGSSSGSSSSGSSGSSGSSAPAASPAPAAG
ncbi:FmdB family zinc ribbon protein [Kitasatospora purpeofusca]|uniref:FmdB family zinc ribbon protein n=1 Tax=Kitasatospora purpeofusca TaxID=67352 RepID=UPI000ABD8478|nr:FmdB family zinc ribbon protein [Kitasatospora purpeofusca]MCX4687381.1 FmdB family transcriptional regulator [Kitasatospora purpeofusca]MCX4754525.1 FmdB family transcriptional regulator [Kitasatospora purpeofusca]WSR33940.1 FmdB family transcriptional regulator [Kitasatospora purpeofusca]